VNSKIGISTAVFAVSVVILLVLSAAGFGLYLSKPSTVQTVTQTVTQTTDVMSGTTTTGMAQATAIQFKPAAGQMFHDGWVVIGQTDSGAYALSIHAEGLESASAGDYIVEGQQSSGSMAVVPLTANTTASEFDAGANGVGSFFITLSQSPFSAYEGIQILYLPGMQMTNATLVATAELSMG